MRRAFRRALVREPSESELATLVDYLKSQREYFKTAQSEAGRVAPTAAAVDPAEAAAWTMAARVLVNLDEFVTRE